MKLILASGSQRRRELLTMCGYDYGIVVSRADEAIDEADPGLYVEALAERKAREVFDRLGGVDEDGESIAVLGSDTVVFSEGSIIGKPKDAQDAVRILSALSGKTHTVYTGIAVVTAAGCETELGKTEVTFEELTEEEIESYVASGEPMDKAGAYGIQGPFGMFVKEVKGNYFTVIGLPLPSAYRLLKNAGILPRDFR
jgi:septum formation protein